MTGEQLTAVSINRKSSCRERKYVVKDHALFYADACLARDGFRRSSHFGADSKNELRARAVYLRNEHPLQILRNRRRADSSFGHIVVGNPIINDAALSGVLAYGRWDVLSDRLARIV